MTPRLPPAPQPDIGALPSACLGIKAHDDAVLEYPQSGERIRGRLAIRTTRGLLPNKHFTIRRVIGRGDLWVTEYVINYDGKPSHTVSIMEFRDGKVFRETQYFGDPFEPWSGRAPWVEPID